MKSPGRRHLSGHALVGAQGQGPLHHPGGREDDAREGSHQRDASLEPSRKQDSDAGLLSRTITITFQRLGGRCARRKSSQNKVWDAFRATSVRAYDDRSYVLL